MIGIYAPYDNSNATTMATGLADLAINMGYSTSIFSFKDDAHTVHDEWDRKIKRDKDTAFYEWVKGCSHIVWFAFHPGRLFLAAKANCRNTLVVLHDYVNHEYKDAPELFDSVLVPSVFVHMQLKELWGTDNLYALPWDPGGPVVSKTKLIDNDKIWVYVPLKGTASELFGPKLIYALSVVMAQEPKVCFTLSHNKRWNRQTQIAIEEVQAAYPFRLHIIAAPKHNMRAAVYRQHDWTFYPADFDDVYIPAIHSLYNGTPVVALGTPPANECVMSGNSGSLIKTHRGPESAWQLPMCVNPTVKELIDGLMSSVCDPGLYHRLVTTPWPFLEMRRRTFTSVWKTVWDEPTTASK